MTFFRPITRLVTPLLAALCLWAAPVLAQGTIPLAMAQQMDINGLPLANCQLYFFVAGTVASPQNSYSDFGLTIPQPNPLSCDQTGRIPMFWLANGLIHIRLTDSSGLQIIDTTMQVLGPSSGGGGGGSTVDPTTILTTGDVKARYGTGPLSGFVRGNGLTIGNASSGATERANADTQALFIYLYGADPNLVVSGGRTGNVLNDYNANKTIALPDYRSRAIGGLDDMGNTAAGRLTLTYFGCTGTVLGCAGGAQNSTLLTTNLPPYSPAGTVATTSTPTNVVQGSPTGSNASFPSGAATQFSGLATASAIASTGTLSGTPQGGTNAPFATVSPMLLATVYIKL